MQRNAVGISLGRLLLQITALSLPASSKLRLAHTCRRAQPLSTNKKTSACTFDLIDPQVLKPKPAALITPAAPGVPDKRLAGDLRMHEKLPTVRGPLPPKATFSESPAAAAPRVPPEQVPAPSGQGSISSQTLEAVRKFRFRMEAAIAPGASSSVYSPLFPSSRFTSAFSAQVLRKLRDVIASTPRKTRKARGCDTQ